MGFAEVRFFASVVVVAFAFLDGDEIVKHITACVMDVNNLTDLTDAVGETVP